jgi:hypothetical protein
VGRPALHEIVPVKGIGPLEPVLAPHVLSQRRVILAAAFVDQDPGDRHAERQRAFSVPHDLVPTDVEPEIPEPGHAVLGFLQPRRADAPQDGPDGRAVVADERQQEMEFPILENGRQLHAGNELHSDLEALLDRFRISVNRVMVGDGDGPEPVLPGLP